MKDFIILKTQRTFFIVLMAIGLLFLIRGENVVEVFAYLSAMLSLMVTATINYDQMDNGMSYLFTFPVSRKKYVLSKYVFGMLMAVCAVAVLSVSMLVMNAVMFIQSGPQEYFTGVCGVLLAPVVIMSVMTPIQLKFGAEKSRIVLLIFVGIIGLLIYVARHFIEMLHVNLTPVYDLVRQAGMVEVAACLGVLAIGLLGISYMASLVIMVKKQF